MNEKRLQEIEAKIEENTTRDGDEDAFIPLDNDCAELIAEVRRLRALVNAAAWKGGSSGSELGFCPWCDGWQETGHVEGCAFVEKL